MDTRNLKMALSQNFESPNRCAFQRRIFLSIVFPIFVLFKPTFYSAKKQKHASHVHFLFFLFPFFFLFFFSRSFYLSSFGMTTTLTMMVDVEDKKLVGCCFAGVVFPSLCSKVSALSLPGLCSVSNMAVTFSSRVL